MAEYNGMLKRLSSGVLIDGCSLLVGDAALPGESTIVALVGLVGPRWRNDPDEVNRLSQL